MTFAPSIRRGIPFDFDPPREGPLGWVALFDNGDWVDSSVYLAATLGDDAGYVAVLYHDQYQQTRRVWGHSYVTYLPDRGTWVGMDERDLSIRTNRGDRMEGQMLGLQLEESVFPGLMRESSMHPQFQEIAPDFEEGHYLWMPTQGLVDQRVPHMSKRYAQTLDPDGDYQRRVRELQQMDIDNYDGSLSHHRYPLPEDNA